MDLLSTVLHEMGNAMGFAEDTGHDVTGMVLSAGERRLPGFAIDTPASPLAPSVFAPGLFAPWTAVGGSGPVSSLTAGHTPAPTIDWTTEKTYASHPGASDNSRDGVPSWLAAFVGQSKDDELYQKPNAGMRFKSTNGLR